MEIIKAIIIDNTNHEFNAFNHFNDYANVWSREPDKNWKLERLIKMISFLMHTYFEHFYTEHVSKENIITFFRQSMSLKLKALQQLTVAPRLSSSLILLCRKTLESKKKLANFHKVLYFFSPIALVNAEFYFLYILKSKKL